MAAPFILWLPVVQFSWEFVPKIIHTVLGEEPCCRTDYYSCVLLLPCNMHTAVQVSVSYHNVFIRRHSVCFIYTGLYFNSPLSVSEGAGTVFLDFYSLNTNAHVFVKILPSDYYTTQCEYNYIAIINVSCYNSSSYMSFQMMMQLLEWTMSFRILQFPHKLLTLQ